MNAHLVPTLLLVLLTSAPEDGPPGPSVEVEEVVAPAVQPGNGSGPLWSYGAPMLVRVGDDVFAGTMEVGPGVPPLCNTRWRLLRRGGSGWVDVYRAEGFREREPCPLAWAGKGGLLLSVNPSTEPPGTLAGRCDPHLLRLDPGDLGRPPVPVRPAWADGSRFTEHSYRGLATDPASGATLVLNIDNATGAQRWALLTVDGRTAGSGEVRFPTRACYPQVALRGRSASVFAVSDEVEPVAAWRDHKRAATGSKWDYVFRRVYFAHASDLAASGFAPPLEVDSVEATGGQLRNLDLWVDPAGAAHLLYLKSNTTPVLRDRFFPGVPIHWSLELAVVEGGRVTRRRTLLRGGEGLPETPQDGRFHETAGHDLLVIGSVAAASGLEDRILRVPEDDAAPIASTRLDLKSPLRMFVTATRRGGSAASDVLDLLGHADGPADLRYVRVRLR